MKENKHVYEKYYRIKINFKYNLLARSGCKFSLANMDE